MEGQPSQLRALRRLDHYSWVRSERLGWLGLCRRFKWVVPRRVLHGNPFQCCEFFKRPLPVQTPDAGGLLATEGHQRFVVDRSVVDVNHSRVNFLRQFRPAFGIARVDRPTQSVRSCVRDSDCLFRRIEGHDTDRWTKQLTLSKPHVGTDIRKNRRGSHVALDFPPQSNPGAFVDSFLYLLGVGLRLPGVDQRADFRLWIAGISHLQLRNPIDKFLQELVVYAALNQNAVRTHAYLSLMREAAEHRRVDRQI